MKLAVNYSPEAADLLIRQEIDFDFFKTPAWDEMIAEASRYRPVAVHFELRAGQQKLSATDWGRVETILKQTNTRYVNVHLGARKKDFEPAFDRLPAQVRRERVAERLAADVLCATQVFGPERVIVENVPYRPGGDEKKLAETIDPEVINAVLSATGCGLLLDLSHARISAATRGQDEKKYIQQLDLSRLREVHITGIHEEENQHLQDHLPMLPADWVWLDWTLEQIATGQWPHPHMLAFEYGGTGPFFGEHSDSEVFASQVPRLLAAVKQLGAES
jgi:uncharacterized protein